MKIYPVVVLMILMFSCTLQKEAFVFVEGQTEGRTTDGYYFVDVKIKNTGEQPAYFVILISKAYLGGKEIQRVERGYGDIFPNETKQSRLIFNQLGVGKPDSVNYKITYSPNNI